jgi:large subunit ribosomal protein L24
MKKEFSTKWKASKKPRKQRKYLANAPLHLKKKMLGVNLSKELREVQGKRTAILRKGDTVKVMRGKFKKTEGKVIEINTKQLKVYVEGIQRKKQDGSKVNVMLRPSNLQIIALDSQDKKRKIKSSGKKEETKKEEKEEKIKENKK